MSVNGGVSHTYVADVLASYALNNLEDAPTMYVGKVQSDGRWLVQRFIKATGFMTYANQSNNASNATYADAWTNRAALTYAAFNEITGV